MEYQSQWSFSTPPVMYNTNQNASPFAASLSSYFRRPSRVIKSTSRNSSPRHTGWRRTTSNAPVSRTQSVADRQRSSMSLAFAKQHRQARPMSWGPASFGDFNSISQNMSPEIPVTNQYQPYNHYGTAAVNGLVTPISYPAMDEPQIHELITPLEELSAQEGQPPFDMSMYREQQYWMPPDMCKEQGYAMDNMFPQTMMPTSWLWTNPTSNVPTAPPSPSFLPMQGLADASPLDLNTRQLPNQPASDDLVSIGLYDSPADVQSSSMSFGGCFTSNPRKSMKLEESFEPERDAEGEEEGSDEDDEKGSEFDEEEESVENASANAQYSTYQEHTAPSHQNALAGQSFLFDGDTNQKPRYTAYPGDNGSGMQNGYPMQYPMYNWI